MKVTISTLESQHDNVVGFDIRLEGTVAEVAQAVQWIKKAIEEIAKRVGE